MPRPRTHDDALRARLLEAASEAVATGGPASTTLREVARAAGTSPSAVYALFGSRDALVAAVAVEAFRRFAAHLASAPRTADAAADLLAIGVAYRDSALADPHFYRVMFDRAPTPGAAVEQPTFVLLRDAVARVLEAATEAAATEAALALWAHVHGLVSLELAGLLPGDDVERGERYVRLLTAVGTALLGGTASAPRAADARPR